MSSARKSESSTASALELKLAHSPDSDDAFMFYALTAGKVKIPGVTVEHVLEDRTAVEPGQRLRRAEPARRPRRHRDPDLRPWPA